MSPCKGGDSNLTKVLVEVISLKKYFPIRGFLFKTEAYVRAVDGVDFHINEGEVFGLVGVSEGRGVSEGAGVGLGVAVGVKVSSPAQ
jgi:ABC-type glutathione transport system ATPase component